MSLHAFRSGAGIVNRSDRGKLHFKGEQAQWFLDQLVTNKVELEPGEGTGALLLTPKGRIVATLRLMAAGGSVFADTETGGGEKLKAFFDERVFTTKVEISDRTSEFAILSVLGPRSDAIVGEVFRERVTSETDEQRALGESIPTEREHHTVHFGAGVLVRVLRPIHGIDLWVKPEEVNELDAALVSAGAEIISSEDYGALCAIEGSQRMGIDFDETFLPQEAALERDVHFAKGCYLGQEAVAMVQRGRVKRRLRRLEFSGSPLMGEIRFEDEGVGKVTSAAAELGSGFGIGVVSTSVADGCNVDVVGEAETAKAEVSELPGTVLGPEAPSARELRERLGR